MVLLLMSVVMAFVLGFSAYRASICSVAAVGEVMSSGTARVFLSFLKVILWVTLVNGLLDLWLSGTGRALAEEPLDLMAVAGGFIFGVGAATNGGCSFSTISKIAQGNLHVALTLPAFAVGVFLSAQLLTRMGPGPSIRMATMNEFWSRVVLVFLVVWAVWEIVNIVRPHLRGKGLWAGLAAGRYRLSTGAAVIGICSGFLYAVYGRWAYSSRLVDSFVERPPAQICDLHAAAWLFIALLAGAVFSAFSSRQLSFSFAADTWIRNVLGGLLMGFGAMMVPGGTAALILHDLPSLSVKALAAYLAMVAGIAVTMMVLGRAMGQTMTVSCRGDMCTVDKGGSKVGDKPASS